MVIAVDNDSPWISCRVRLNHSLIHLRNSIQSTHSVLFVMSYTHTPRCLSLSLSLSLCACLFIITPMAPSPPPQPTAFPKDLSDQADSRQEAAAKPPVAALGPFANRQHCQIQHEASSLASYQARTLSATTLRCCCIVQ